MTMVRLDHVNIRTARLADCVAFYGGVLGLPMQPPPMESDMSRGAYACDAGGHPIVHLVATDRIAEGGGPVRGAAQRGMVDHFALRCDGEPDDYAARIAASGTPFDRMDVPQIGMHLIFVRDPNDVLVELGFPLVAAGTERPA